MVKLILNFEVKNEVNLKYFETFILTAKHWSNVYAGSPYKVPECDEKVRRFIDIGVEENVARVALSSCSWNLEKAKEILLEKSKYNFTPFQRVFRKGKGRG